MGIKYHHGSFFGENMQNFYNQIILLSDGIEAKISFAAFAAYVSFNLGGSVWLLLMVQYIFMVDFFLGVLDASKAKKFSWTKVRFGIKKVISLYFGVLVVGFGTKAFDAAVSQKIQIEYNGVFFFDLFICVLIIFELASINRHLANFGFGVNKGIDSFFSRFQGKIHQKIEKKINNFLDSDKH